MVTDIEPQRHVPVTLGVREEIECAFGSPVKDGILLFIACVNEEFMVSVLIQKQDEIQILVKDHFDLEIGLGIEVMMADMQALRCPSCIRWLYFHRGVIA